MSIILDIKVVPQAHKTICTLNKANIIVCYVKSSPEKGLANKELVNYIARTIGVTQKQIDIIAGLTSRKKRIKIDTTMSKEQVLHLLGMDQKQLSLFFK